MATAGGGGNGGSDESFNPNQSQASQSTFASSFKGRNTSKTADELKKARESRAADALRMKDEQLKILSEQNASLLQSLDKVCKIKS